MYTLECHVGRLFEIRVQPPLSVEELKGFHPQVVRILGRVPGQLIGCTDLRKARVFNLDVADRLMAIIRAEAPRVERNAYLVGESAVFSMQIARVIRAAGIPSRKAFTSPDEAVTWLSESLTEPELRRLRTFIAEGDAPP
jgi:hypothetical protein